MFRRILPLQGTVNRNERGNIVHIHEFCDRPLVLNTFEVEVLLPRSGKQLHPKLNSELRTSLPRAQKKVSPGWTQTQQDPAKTVQSEPSLDKE